MPDALTRSLEGRVVLVTGGAVRLGRAIVKGFFRRGARLAFTWSRSGDEAETLLDELRAIDRDRGEEALAVRCDVRSEDEVARAFETFDGRFERLDVLVNNAAIFERTPFASIEPADWRRHLDVNLTGPFLVAREGVPRMLAVRREDGAGADAALLVNVACASSVRPWKGHVAYSVSKAGLLMLTQVLARELAPRVRVNAVAPGPVLLPESYDDAQRARAIGWTALKRAGAPDDVVRAILHLWDADYTTGALLPVEGGRLLV